MSQHDLFASESGPDPSAWLALDEDARKAAILDAHPEPLTGIHEGLRGSLAHHVTLHVAIETQVALGEPALTGATLARLQQAGLRRHPATHLLMTALVQTMHEVMAGASFDEVWARRLGALEPADYIAAELRRRTAR